MLVVGRLLLLQLLLLLKLLLLLLLLKLLLLLGSCQLREQAAVGGVDIDCAVTAAVGRNWKDSSKGES